MNLSTIEMSKTEAEAAFEEWVEGTTPEDAAIREGYRVLKAGKKLITLSDTITAGGQDEGFRPRLAVAPALASLIYLYRNTKGRVAFSASNSADTSRWNWNMAVAPGRLILGKVLPELTVANYDNTRPGDVTWEQSNNLGRLGWTAMVPVIPPRFRTRGYKSCWILFEAEWAWNEPPAPIDPALIQHLRGDLWIVRGVWDLTPLEQAVLTERNRVRV